MNDFREELKDKQYFQLVQLEESFKNSARSALEAGHYSILKDHAAILEMIREEKRYRG